MGALIARIAAYLISKWSSLSNLTKWAIAAIAGNAIYDAVAAGTSALINFLFRMVYIFCFTFLYCSIPFSGDKTLKRTQGYGTCLHDSYKQYFI